MSEEEKLNPYNSVSFFDGSFIDLWLQKIFRNVASIKYQFMVAFYILVTYGMFVRRTAEGEPFISAVLGLSFLGGGFITLATSRLIVRTSLFAPKDDMKPVPKVGVDAK